MSGETILIIDDSREVVTHLVEDVFPKYNYRLLFSYDGQIGFDLMREEQPDLVLLDYHLPSMTGLDIMQQMVQESINIPVILMTGYGSELSAINAFRLGAKDYLVKPFTIDEIVAMVDGALSETRLQHDNERLFGRGASFKKRNVQSHLTTWIWSELAHWQRPLLSPS